MKFIKLIGAVAFVSSFAVGAGAEAETWTQSHPRRAEVDGRLANQNARINQGVRDG